MVERTSGKLGGSDKRWDVESSKVIVVVTAMSGEVIYRESINRESTIAYIKEECLRDASVQLSWGTTLLEDRATLESSFGSFPAEVHLNATFLSPFYEEGAEDELSKKYALVQKIGCGTYGTVFQCRRLDAGHEDELVAIKKIGIQYEDEGVPATSLREIALLIDVDHPNIVHLQEVVTTKHHLFLVFECLDMDLRMYLKQHGALRGGLQSAVRQCCEGIFFCHSNRILHRDLKTQNVLVNLATMQLKLADFGLARIYQATVPSKVYTHEVVTLWYRAIEILLGQMHYSVSVDVWSLGCVVAEMATAEALFPGDSEIGTVYKIFQKLGTPSEQDWRGVTRLPCFSKQFPLWRPTGLEDVRLKAPALGVAGIDFLQNCLKYDESRRPSARKLLEHEFLVN